MSKTILMDFQVDQEARKITVKREFDAPRDLVWRAWTEKEILDQWWAPQPWKTVTKSMDFREGGRWHYYMEGPKGERHFAFLDYMTVKPRESFSGEDGFCDENGEPANLPRSKWNNRFVDQGDTTLVDITIRFDKPEDLKAIIDMGFKEGFTAGLENLDHWLSTHFRLRAENKSGKQPQTRVTSYLNFPGTTEAAFNFYKTVFRGRFVGRGLTRFGDAELPAGHPSLSDADRRLIIHAELEIAGGHILMATDAPESMGMTVQYGNNMHINVELETKGETERLYRELSAGGEVSMPLQLMFWGAYFASFKDRFGVNWMLSHQPAKQEGV